MAAHAVQLRPTVLFRAERGVPLRSLRDDEGDVAQRFDVVDRRRLAIQADEGRKWRLVARLGALAFQRLEERRLLARLVRAGAPVHVHVAIKARPEDVPAEEPARIRLVDRALEDVLHVQELAADVDVGDPRANRVTADRTPFGFVAEGQALHAFALTGEHHPSQIAGKQDIAPIRLGRHQDRLPASLQTAAASRVAFAPQTRRFHHVDNLIGPVGQRLLQRFVSFVLDIEIEREGIRLADVLDENGIHVLLRLITKVRRDTKATKHFLYGKFFVTLRILRVFVKTRHRLPPSTT